MWTLNERYSFKTLDPDVVTRNGPLIARLKRVPLEQNIWESGAPGLAKTHLAKCALNRHHFRGLKVDVITGLEFRAMGEQFPADREEDQRRYIGPDLLLIDDIDKIELTNKALESMWYVMHCRYMAGKRTIVTSNMNARALADEWRKVRGVNQTMLTALLDRFNPCVQFVVTGQDSMRKTHAPKCMSVPQPLGDLVSPEEAAQVRQAVDGGGLWKLVNQQAQQGQNTEAA